MIADAALLLSTSDSEGFPNTFVQAWSSGTPVVSLKIDPDRVIEGLGLGTVSENVDRAIEDITALIESTHRREEIAKRARQCVRTTVHPPSLASLNVRLMASIEKPYGRKIKHRRSKRFVPAPLDTLGQA